MQFWKLLLDQWNLSKRPTYALSKHYLSAHQPLKDETWSSEEMKRMPALHAKIKYTIFKYAYSSTAELTASHLYIQIHYEDGGFILYIKLFISPCKTQIQNWIKYEAQHIEIYIASCAFLFCTMHRSQSTLEAVARTVP